MGTISRAWLGYATPTQVVQIVSQMEYNFHEWQGYTYILIVEAKEKIDIGLCMHYNGSQIGKTKHNLHLTPGIILSCTTLVSSFRFWIVRPNLTLKMKNNAEAKENKQFGLYG
jgi:hypothetical protein